ncbi:MAG: large conductance mechanosensitive channel protein MscL [Clostridia bacterium]|nr:large conductance mechanosensitive channel protein MscL [Clostridia bacterium]
MKKTGFFAEFKKFIMRGNVIDLAVGVIIGGAFQAIVNSLVNDLISPLLGLIGGTDFTKYAITLKEAVVDKATGEVTSEAVMLNYGAFITAVINFLIMAFIIFLLVKTINKISDLGKKKEEEAPAAPTTKVCPFCKSEIAIDAVKCAHCTSDVE